MVHVNKTRLPNIFKALAEIDLCNGAVNRFTPARRQYVIPAPYDIDLQVIEDQIEGLTKEEFELMTDGEESEMDALIERKNLQPTANLLTAFFDGWPEGTKGL